jgi:hypothetical protein
MGQVKKKVCHRAYPSNKKKQMMIALIIIRPGKCQGGSVPGKIP